jgi:hypothetical protein
LKTERGKSQNILADENPLTGEIFRLLACYPKFSSLRINNLSVSLIGRSGDPAEHPALNILTAGRAESGSDQALRLRDCEFLTLDGERIRSTKAMLHLGDRVCISSGGTTYDLFGLSRGHSGTQFKLTQNGKVGGHDEKGNHSVLSTGSCSIRDVRAAWNSIF